VGGLVKYEGGKWEVRATCLRQAGELRDLN
jgi:hypothetical protein